MNPENCTALRKALGTLQRLLGERYLLEYLQLPTSYHARVLDSDYDAIAREFCPSLPALKAS
jgi:hypothetical protein